MQFYVLLLLRLPIPCVQATITKKKINKLKTKKNKQKTRRKGNSACTTISIENSSCIKSNKNKISCTGSSYWSWGEVLLVISNWGGVLLVVSNWGGVLLVISKRVYTWLRSINQLLALQWSHVVSFFSYFCAFNYSYL